MKKEFKLTPADIKNIGGKPSPFLDNSVNEDGVKLTFEEDTSNPKFSFYNHDKLKAKYMISREMILWIAKELGVIKGVKAQTIDVDGMVVNIKKGQYTV